MFITYSGNKCDNDVIIYSETLTKAAKLSVKLENTTVKNHKTKQ